MRRLVVRGVLLATSGLVLTACSAADSANSGGPPSEVGPAAQIDESQFLDACLERQGWTFTTTAGTEERGLEDMKLQRNPDFKAAERGCSAKLQKRLPPDIISQLPSEAQAQVVEAGRATYQSCLENEGLHPQLDDGMTIQGLGYAYSFSDEDKTRSDFADLLKQCGDEARVSGEQKAQQLLTELSGDE